MSLGIVTDSTAALPPGLCADRGIAVVGISVNAAGRGHVEGVDLSPEELADHLAHGRAVTTAAPSPASFADCYERLARAGARAIVSVHLAGALSATLDHARLAASAARVPVEVVDSGSAGMVVGFAALAARAAGPTLSGARAACEATSANAQLHFAVDSLDYLRRGGRIGRPRAAVGTALGLRPVLTLRDGSVELVTAVRGEARVESALAQAAARAAEELGGPGRTRLAVHHLAALTRGERLRARVAEVLAVDPDAIPLVGVPAVLACHTGPGALGVAIARRVDAA